MEEKDNEGRQLRLIEMPFAFTGMGIFRVWTETVYANGSVVFPAQAFSGWGFTAFNLMAAAVLLIFAFLSRRIAPLWGRRGILALTGACLVTSACLNYLSIYWPACSMAVGFPAALLGAVGIALIILLWSELFGCMGPLRVAVYFSGGLVVGALILWLFKGLALPWLWTCTCLVPVASLWCLRRAYALLPDNERPHAAWGEFSFPWKPIAIVALYSFAYGMCENVFGATLGIHSGFGCVAAAVVVYLAVSVRRDQLQLSFTYKVACPLMLISLVPLASFLPLGAEVSSFCALAGYTFVLIAIMVVLSNLTYQYGFCALWLFGIERATRLISVELGLAVTRGVSGTEMGFILPMITAVSVVVATLFFLSEGQLVSRWGAVLKDPQALSWENKSRIGTKCNELGKTFGLTSREEEILVLLAQGKKNAEIAKELYVAPSTVKTHIKHVYQKLEVHSRRELALLVGVQPDEEAADAG